MYKLDKTKSKTQTFELSEKDCLFPASTPYGQRRGRSGARSRCAGGMAGGTHVTQAAGGCRVCSDGPGPGNPGHSDRPGSNLAATVPGNLAGNPAA